MFWCMQSPSLDDSLAAVFCTIRSLLLLHFHELLLTLKYLYLLAFFPDSVNLLAIILTIDAFAMLFSIMKLALVHASVRPRVHSLTVFLIIDVLSIIDSAIGPSEFAFSVHFIITPFSVILRTVCPLKYASPVLFAFQIVTIEEGTIWPRFTSPPFLLVFIPLSFVSRSFSIVIVAYAVRFVVDPLTFEYVAVCKNEAAIAISHVIFPKSLKLAAIGPHLQTITFFRLALFVPLT